ncbi:MAG: hypothetical protein AAF628_37490 [Planctomycetota bacterium]
MHVALLSGVADMEAQALQHAERWSGCVGRWVSESSVGCASIIFALHAVGVALAALDRPAEAIATLTKATDELARRPKVPWKTAWPTVAELARLHVEAGRREDADRVLTEFAQRSRQASDRAAAWRAEH